MEMMLPVMLTDDEKLAKSAEMVGLILEAVKTEEDQKTAAAKFRAELKQLGGDVRSLAGQLSSGTEDRNVVCEVNKDFGAEKVETVRMDTGEVVSSRAMTEEDSQQDLTDMVETGLNQISDASAEGEEAADGDPVKTEGQEESSDFPGGIGDESENVPTGLPGPG